MKQLSDLFKGLDSKTSATPFKSNWPEQETVTAEMIHEEFYHACDSVIAEAESETTRATIQKADRLRKLGFTSMPAVDDSEGLGRLAQVAKVISKYAVSHPNNKVITGSEAHRICTKYNLAFRPASDYKGEIPEKNLTEIENFRAPDSLQGIYYTYQSSSGSHDCFLRNESLDYELGFFFSAYDGSKYQEKSGAAQTALQICAPVKDIKLRPYEKIDEKTGQIVPKDPIVLFPVENNCYLIVTAWGEEAKEVNEKLN